MGQGRGRLTSIPAAQTQLLIRSHLREEADRGVGLSLSGHPEDCLTRRKGADVVLQVCLSGASVQNRVQLVLWGEMWRLQEANRGQNPAWLDLVLSQGVCRQQRGRVPGNAFWAVLSSALLFPPKLVTDCVRSSC